MLSSSWFVTNSRRFVFACLTILICMIKIVSLIEIACGLICKFSTGYNDFDVEKSLTFLSTEKHFWWHGIIMVTLFYICNIYGKCFMQYNASKWLFYSSYTHFYRASCEDNTEMFLSKSYFVTFMICKNDHLICFSPTIHFYDMNTIVFKERRLLMMMKIMRILLQRHLTRSNIRVQFNLLH